MNRISFIRDMLQGGLESIIDQSGTAVEQIMLRIKKKKSRINDPNAAKHDEDFDVIRRDVIYSAQSTCQGCNAPTKITSKQPQGYYELHHIDDDHSNSSFENLTFLCPFCHMQHMCGKHGDDFKNPRQDSAYLLYLPKIKQKTLNLTAHIVFQLIYLDKNRSQGKKNFRQTRGGLNPETWIPPGIGQVMEKQENEIITFGQKRLNAVFEHFFKGEFSKKFDNSTVQCYHLYDWMYEINEKKALERMSVWEGLRIWPKKEKFEEMIAYSVNHGKLLSVIPKKIFER